MKYCHMSSRSRLRYRDRRLPHPVFTVISFLHLNRIIANFAETLEGDAENPADTSTSRLLAALEQDN